MFWFFYFYFKSSSTGVGPRYELERHGIPVLSDLPVGHNLQDHIYPLGLNFIADASMKPKGVTWTYIQNQVHNLPNIMQYFSFAKGPIASIGALEGLGFIRTRFANYTHRDWPDFQIHFLSGCLSSGKFKSCHLITWPHLLMSTFIYCYPRWWTHIQRSYRNYWSRLVWSLLSLCSSRMFYTFTCHA